MITCSNSADGPDGSYNQTNLALKGILGVRAMSELARIYGDTNAATAYSVRGYCDTFTSLLCINSSFYLYSLKPKI
jgi:hypothetical protein